MNSNVSSASVSSHVNTWNNGIRRSEQVAIERARTAELAHHLSSVALQQWEKTLTGIVALPAAAALGIAATATYGVALLERGFDVFESALGSVGQSLVQERHHHEGVDPHEVARNDARS
jgi:hypothetical protein